MGEKDVVDFSRMLPRLIAMGSLPRRIRKPHHAAADVIDRIIVGKNSVRHAATKAERADEHQLLSTHCRDERQ